MLTEDTKFEILHDHYKDTFAHIQNYLKLRDKLFLMLLVVVALMLFQVFSPRESGEAISQFISKQFDLKNPIDISFISSILWFALLSLVVRYFQTVVHIERQYEYIHDLEEQLSKIYENKVFTREGKFYLSNYPLFSNWTWILYTIIFPVLLLILVLVKIFGELSGLTSFTLLLFINIAISICILISTIFYLLLVHFRK